MKIVVIADIHANLEALQSLKEEIDKISPQKVICLGDIVGYGANPNECIEIVRDNAWVSLMGNHDAVAFSEGELSFFNPFAKESLLWTRDVLTEEAKEYLKNRPFLYEDDYCIGVHSSLFEPNRFHYLDNYSDISKDFSLLEEEKVNLCFVAHTHIPSIFVYKAGNLYRDYSSRVEIKSKSSYMINVGSIGQPRDRNPDISFCVWDLEKSQVRLVRKQYNINKAQEKIIKAKLPNILAERLEPGW